MAPEVIEGVVEYRDVNIFEVNDIGSKNSETISDLPCVNCVYSCWG